MNIKVSPYVAERIGRKKSDFRLDVFCSGGPGGQAQNKRKTGARYTDKVTGISAESRDATGLDDNKKRAFTRLVQRLVEHYNQEERSTTHNSRNLEVIRSYNEKESRVIDKRLGKDKVYNYQEILNGRLDDLLNDLLVERSLDSK